MDAVRQTEKKYCSGAMTLAIIIAFILILAGHKPLGKGLMLGTIFSVINFVLIGETLPMKIGKTRQKAVLISLGSLGFRYLLLAIPLIVSIKFEDYNLFAAIAGIFMVQMVILADHIVAALSSRHKT